jgi:hypothetical protein
MSLLSSFGDAIGGQLKSLPLVGGMVSDFQKGQDEDKLKAEAANRPKYSPPTEIQQYMELAKSGANSTMPGSDQAKQNIGSTTSSAINNVQNLTESPTSSLGAIEQLARQQLGAYSNLSVQQQQYHENKIKELQNALQTGAKYSDQAWDYNVNQPWQFNMNWMENKYAADQQDSRTARANDQQMKMAAASMLTGGK